MKRIMGCLAMCAGLAVSGLSEAHAAALRVTDAWVRLPPPPIQTAAAYMTITNDGDVAVVIDAVTSPRAASAGFHRTLADGGMMRMAPVARLTIPAHGRQILAPGGMHVMLDGLTGALKADERVRLVLHTTAGDTVSVEAPVRAAGHAAEPDQRDFSRGMQLLRAHDAAAAAALFEHAARQGNRRAQYQLGLLYARGEGVQKNLVRARALLHKAAVQGHPKAQFYLGQMYAFGDGGERDNVTATMWFWLATTLGDRYARDNLRVMTGKISSAELAEAKRRAKLLWRKMPHDMKIKRRMTMH